MRYKPFYFSIKKVSDCLFSRRYGHIGNIILGYSVIIRLFGVNLTKQ